MRAFGKISFCDITAEYGRKRSTIERTYGRIAGLVSSTGASPDLRLSLEGRARPTPMNSCNLRWRQGELLVVAVADQRFGEGLLPFRRQA